MKLHHFTSLLCAPVLVGLIAWVGMRHREIWRLQHDTPEFAQLPRAAGVEAPSEPAPVSTEAPLNTAELRELLSLRGEVNRLLQDKLRLAALEAENARLKSAIVATASDTNRVPVPENYITANHARFLGFATPADALESFLWSLQNRDTNVLFQALTPAFAKSLAEDPSHRGPEGFFDNVSKILPGFFINSVVENADGTASAEVQIDPANPAMTQKLPLERDEQGAWRLPLQ
jgi:hypothetical protein